MTQLDVAQQAVTANFQSRAEYYVRQGSTGDKRNRADSSGSTDERGSPRECGKRCERKKRGMWVFFSAVYQESVQTLNM